MPTKNLVPKTFRITKRHKFMLELQPFNEAPGLLVRVLLEDFFNGLLPTQQKKFMESLTKYREQEAIRRGKVTLADFLNKKG